MDRKFVRRLGVLFMALGALLLFALPTALATTVVPSAIDENPKCSDPATSLLSLTKFDNSPGSGSQDGVTITVTGAVFDWTSETPVDEVIVKGGDNSNVYAYDEATSDTGLTTITNPRNNLPFGISHIEFCYDTASVDGGTPGDDPSGDDDTVNQSDDDSQGDDSADPGDDDSSDDDTVADDDSQGDDSVGDDDSQGDDDSVDPGDDDSQGDDDSVGDDDSQGDDDTVGDDDSQGDDDTVGDDDSQGDDDTVGDDDTTGGDDDTVGDDDSTGGDDDTIGDDDSQGDDDSVNDPGDDDSQGDDDSSTVSETGDPADPTAVEANSTVDDPTRVLGLRLARTGSQQQALALGALGLLGIGWTVRLTASRKPKPVEVEQQD